MLWTILIAPFLGIGAYFHWRILEMESWPQAQAVILESRIKFVVSIDTRSSGGTWKPVIRYRYEVGGRTYTGNRVGSMNISSGMRDKIRDVIGRHPAGSKAQIHYNPSRPSEAVLEPLWIGLAYYFYAIGGLVSIIPLWRLFKRTRR